MQSGSDLTRNSQANITASLIQAWNDEGMPQWKIALIVLSSLTVLFLLSYHYHLRNKRNQSPTHMPIPDDHAHYNVNDLNNGELSGTYQNFPAWHPLLTFQGHSAVINNGDDESPSSLNQCNKPF